MGSRVLYGGFFVPCDNDVQHREIGVSDSSGRRNGCLLAWLSRGCSYLPGLSAEPASVHAYQVL